MKKKIKFESDSQRFLLSILHCGVIIMVMLLAAPSMVRAQTGGGDPGPGEGQNLTISVPPITAVVGGNNGGYVIVTDATGHGVNGVTLTVVAPTSGNATATAAFGTGAGENVTDVNGHCVIQVTGVAAGTTPLTISGGGATGTNTITIVAPTITITDITVVVGGRNGEHAIVTDGAGHPANGVTLTISAPTGTNTTATAGFGRDAGSNITNLSGSCFISVKGLAAGTTPLTIGGGGVTTTKTITVVVPTVTVPAITVAANGGTNTGNVQVTDGAGHGAFGVALVVVAPTSTNTTAIARFGTEAGESSTDLNGYCAVQAVGQTVHGTTPLTIQASASGVTGTNTITVP